jgi:hypothetical protein
MFGSFATCLKQSVKARVRLEYWVSFWRVAMTRLAIHSAPMRAPFSATERFISRVTNASTNVRAAKIQKQSK